MRSDMQGVLRFVIHSKLHVWRGMDLILMILGYLMVFARVQYWVLFCFVFILLNALKSAKYGCYTGFCFVEELVYADDLVLLAPSPNATKHMLKICDEFSERYSVIFNAIKFKCLLCLSSNRSCRLPHATTPFFYVGGSIIEFVNERSHLGHFISTSGDDMRDIESRKSSLIGRINGIMCDFRNVTCNTKIRLIKTYCTSLYGAELWDLSNNCIDSICIAWRRGVRKVRRLPSATHSSLLPGISNTMINLLDVS